MYKLANILVSALFCVAAVSAFTAQGDFDECSGNAKDTEILKVDQCVKITCAEDDSSFGHLVGCGVSAIELTRVQTLRGCEVKEKEVSAEIRYPECCEKYVQCPPVESSDSPHDIPMFLKRFLAARQ